MIVIRVELWSAVSGRQTELARMVIDNIGGTEHLGDYRARTLRGRSSDQLNKSLFKMETTGTQRDGRVLRHPRLREHVWNLVSKALVNLGYGHKAIAEPAPALVQAAPPAPVVGELVEALEPFAKAGKIRLCGGEDYWTAEKSIQGTDLAFHITFGDLRRAASTLAKHGGPGA